MASRQRRSLGSTQRATAPAAPAVQGLDTEVLTITPVMAEAILDFKQPNRPIADRKAEVYGRDMKSGSWHLNGEPIIFTGTRDEVMTAIALTGEARQKYVEQHRIGLIDGQHRCWASVETQASFQTLVVYGVPAQSMDSIDTGFARTFGHVMAIKGNKNSNVVAGAARLWWWYDRGAGMNFKSGRVAPTHHELLQTVAEHPNIREAAQMAANARHASRLVPPSTLAFVLTAALDRDPEKAREFVRMLDGRVEPEDDYGDTHPIRTLERRMIADKLNPGAKLKPTYVVAYAVKTWNYFYKGRPNRQLRWNTQGEKPESFPRFEV